MRNPARGLCLIPDRHEAIRSAYSRNGSGWTENNSVDVYCIRHIAQNFMRQFKNAALKKDIANMGTKALAIGEMHNASFKTNFCLQLAYKTMLKQVGNGSNFVYSPLSLHIIMSLLAVGTKGKTLQQLLSVLGSESIHEVNSLSSQIISYIQLAEGNGSHSGGPILSFINGAWVEQSFGLKKSFEEVVKQVYRLSQVKEVDFKNKFFEVREEVNAWADNATNGLIKELLPANSLSSLTRLILVNAMYFKGTWPLDQRFDASNTKTKTFNLLNGQKVKVPFMTNFEFVNYNFKSFETFKILQIPYQSGDNNPLTFSMYFFLPHEKEGLPYLIHILNSNTEFLNQNFGLHKVNIPNFWIPRFKFSFDFEAKEDMENLGLTLPFKISGDLTEFSDSPLSSELYVSKIFHKACIEVNEEGTEASASTAVIISQQRAMMPIPSFVADHPFVFMIREETSMAVFFIGAVVNPLLVS
ncbi:serpin-ZXA-like [Abrus precatorius]|uniref:Serpin-ZXA-like n=1 Tax=Abrus precatorius TaxID=3816 RepID=A0A8B8LVE8_ABRPR|nr:serpin-ZXA-like [Abrus precatorius]